MGAKVKLMARRKDAMKMDMIRGIDLRVIMGYSWVRFLINVLNKVNFGLWGIL
ncbi:MAG: hypothetical protein ACXITR_10615 [Cyanobacterium sp.]